MPASDVAIDSVTPMAAAVPIPQVVRQLPTSQAVTLPELSPKRHITSGVVDLLAGTLAGMAGRFIEMPADTVKVRLQTSSQYNGAIDCIRRTYTTEGVWGFYKGISAPLLASMAENSILFYGFEAAKRRILAGEERDLNMGESMVAGGLSGAAVTYWLAPFEFVKVRLQSNLTTGEYRGPADVVRKTFRESGVTGFYRGALPTLLREAPGNAIYFGAYTVATRELCRVNGVERKDMPAVYSIVAGSLAGIAFTLSIFPFDVIKSKMQTAQLHEKTSIVKLCINTVKSGGIRGLYSGLGVTLIRSVPANGAIFFTYESSKRYLMGFVE